ncbi:MAG: aminotransferase class III-fold pyridoxal phosphate-dependent enzyme [Pseudomonadota bacterium]
MGWRYAGDYVLPNVVRGEGVWAYDDDGVYLRERLQEELGDHSNVGDIRGRGLFNGLEFMEDREKKKPFAPDREVSELVFLKAAQENGLLVYPTSTMIDGIHGNGIVIAPAYTVSREDIDEIVLRLKRSIVSVLGS